MKLDFLVAARMCTWWYVVLFAALGVVIPLFWKPEVPMFPVIFALFAMLTMVATPFFAQDKFTQILPIRISQRIFGRFFFGAVSLAATAVLGAGSSFLGLLLAGRAAEMQFLWNTVFLLGLSIILVSLEFMTLYIFQIKNATVMSLIRMVPAFVFFYGILSLPEDMLQGLPGVLRYLAEHFSAVSLLTLAAGLAVMCICAGTACLAEGRRY